MFAPSSTTRLQSVVRRSTDAAVSDLSNSATHAHVAAGVQVKTGASGEKPPRLSVLLRGVMLPLVTARRRRLRAIQQRKTHVAFRQPPPCGCRYDGNKVSNHICS